MDRNGGALLARAKSGDVEAFERLAEPYYKKVYSIALKASGSSEEAGILAQEVFVKVFKSISVLESADGFTYLVFKTLKNAIISVSATDTAYSFGCSWKSRYINSAVRKNVVE